MSQSLAALNASPRRITLGGEAYDVHPLTLGALGQLQAWLDAAQPDPLAAAQAHIDRTRPPMEVQKFLLREALHEASRTRVFVGTPEANPYINSPDGICEVLWLTVAPGRPDMKREEFVALAKRLTPTEIIRLQQAAELDKVMSDDDPKAAGA